VALNKSFFATLPKLKRVSKSKADIAWLIYDIVSPSSHTDPHTSLQMKLVKHEIIYSKWPDFLESTSIATTEPVDAFLKRLDTMLEEVVV
jgi:hypothetical protein